MDIDLTPGQKRLRAELREYFTTCLTGEDQRKIAEDPFGEAYMEHCRRLGRDGKLGPGWPAEYGGGGYGPLEQQIFANEIARAEVPYPIITLQTVGPTLMQYGTPEQKEFLLPMIRHWADAMGDANPLYTDEEFAAGSVHGEIVAPPAMIQVWTMPGLRQGQGVRTPVDDMLAALDESGFTGVVATNCEQTHHRYLRLGERLVPATRMTGLSGPKTTALGVGYFVTWLVT